MDRFEFQQKNKIKNGTSRNYVMFLQAPNKMNHKSLSFKKKNKN